MKKLVVVFVLMVVFCPICFAGDEYNDDGYSLNSLWEQNGKFEQKVLSIGFKILNDNKIEKRVTFLFGRNKKNINAYAHSTSKTVVITKGLFPYIDSDDELAAVLAHEIVHNIDFYRGLGVRILMGYFPRNFEKRADLGAIDLLVNAGYNPLALIVVENKVLGEYNFDKTHPKGTDRLLYEYYYIKQNYPQFLQNNVYENNIYYKNFLLVTAKQRAKIENNSL